MKSLDGLWAWQERERRALAGLPLQQWKDWKWVPSDPTQSMIIAGFEASGSTKSGTIYKAMLKAAPQTWPRIEQPNVPTSGAIFSPIVEAIPEVCTTPDKNTINMQAYGPDGKMSWMQTRSSFDTKHDGHMIDGILMLEEASAKRGVPIHTKLGALWLSSTEPAKALKQKPVAEVRQSGDGDLTYIHVFGDDLPLGTQLFL